VPSAYRVNPELQEELGFLPLLAAAPSVIGGAGKVAGGLVKGIGSLFGKKKKKAAPAPTAAKASAASSGASSARSSGAGSVASPQVSASLAGVDKDIKAEALAALQSYQKSNRSDKQRHAELVKKLAGVVKPAIDKIQADVKTQALKTQVTSEHNKLVQDKERWDANDAAHRAIMAKFDQLEAALTGSAERNRRVFRIYGINI
jgi:hypothetical protein